MAIDQRRRTGIRWWCRAAVLCLLGACGSPGWHPPADPDAGTWLETPMSGLSDAATISYTSFDDGDGGTVTSGGASCSSVSCSGGTTCVAGACRQMCTSDSECGAGTGGCCNQSALMVQSMICNIPSANCDPLAGTGCPDQTGCYFLPCSAHQGNSDCLPYVGMGDVGASCAHINDCKPGLTCISLAGTLACHKLCSMGSTSDCGGQKCAAVASWSGSYGYCP